MKSLAVELPHCTRDWYTSTVSPNLPLHMLGGGQPRPISPAFPLFSQTTLNTTCVSPGLLRCKHQGRVKHAKIFMPMGRTNGEGAQNAGDPCQTSKQVLPHMKERGKKGIGWKHPRLPQSLRKFQQGSSQSHLSEKPWYPCILSHWLAAPRWEAWTQQKYIALDSRVKYQGCQVNYDPSTSMSEWYNRHSTMSQTFPDSSWAE